MRCAGLYGQLALIGQTRALARATMDEFFLFPEGAPTDVARETYWLNNATERLGSLGDMNPYKWHTGSAESAVAAVAHADKIAVLALRTARYVQSALRADEDNVARLIVAPDVTDGGLIHAGNVLSYSGPDSGRYQVTLATLERRPFKDYPAVDTKPVRAYWGSCGVQKPTQGDRSYVSERRFQVERKAAGSYVVRADERTFTIAAEAVECASMNADGSRLAVVDGNGVALYDVSTDAPVPVTRLDDPSIDTVSFSGKAQTTLLTAHDFKVMAWN